MDTVEFENRIKQLLPDADMTVMPFWIAYATELDQAENISREDYFDEMYAELYLVNKRYGGDIARRIFDAAKSFTFNPFEVRRAAALLREGAEMEEVFQKALDGLCEDTAEEAAERKAEVERLRHYETDDGQTLKM